MSQEFWIELVIAVLSSGAIASLLTHIINRRQRNVEIRHLMALVGKTDAETSQIKANTYQQAVDIAMRLAEGLQAHIDALEKELRTEQEVRGLLQEQFAQLEKRYQRLLAGVRALLGQLYDNDIQPCWLPDEDEVTDG